MTLRVRAHDSSAPTAEALLGRPDIPLIAGALLKVGASVKGLLSDPLHPSSARNRLLADWDRGLDVELEGGSRLRALDGIDGKFHVHLVPRSLKKSSIHVELAALGNEKMAVVQTHAHAPKAPVGFYNAALATEALARLRAILTAAIESSDTSAVNRLRAGAIIQRLDVTTAYLEALKAAIDAHPALASVAVAAKLAYEVKKAGDATDRQLAKTLETIRAFLADRAGAIGPELASQVRRDLVTIEADRKKWVDWRASTGVFKFYVGDDF